jgi:V/A-type H+-transporting ATPase subunit D
VALLHRVPPGRSGRLWLERRLAVARRGAEVLDEKIRVLEAESRRVAADVDATGDEWESAAREARVWLQRTGLLDGERGLRLARQQDDATVEVSWGQLMGLRYPRDAVCGGSTDDARPPVGSSAQDAAREACARALDAAARHAVARGAHAAIEREKAATRRRLRAVEERWVPLLEDAVAQVELSIAEHELGELVRLRWMTDRPAPTADRRADATPGP